MNANLFIDNRRLLKFLPTWLQSYIPIDRSQNLKELSFKDRGPHCSWIYLEISISGMKYINLPSYFFLNGLNINLP